LATGNRCPKTLLLRAAEVNVAAVPGDQSFLSAKKQRE
jgi:hypothetical protein